jgi:hypothetical protein
MVREDEMGALCSIYWGEVKTLEILVRKPKEKDSWRI